MGYLCFLVLCFGVDLAIVLCRSYDGGGRLDVFFSGGNSRSDEKTYWRAESREEFMLWCLMI